MNYAIAEKNPEKFYQQVFNQDITQHKLKEEQKSPNVYKKSKTEVEVKSKVTKRPFVKMMEKIKAKIVDSLRKKIGDEFG